MAEHIEVAQAYVTIIPSLEGSQSTITKELTGVTESAAASAGDSSGAAFAGALATGITASAAVIAAAVTAVAVSAVEITSSFIEATTSVAEYGDEVDKTSQKLGISTQAYQEWDYVLQLAGTDMSSMTVGFKTLNNHIADATSGSEDAIAMFESLGISLEDLQNMNTEEVFAAAVEGFQNMEDGADRSALAVDLFGKSGQNMAALFNMSNEEVEEAIALANEYGMVMDDEAIAGAVEYKDSLTTLENTMEGLKNSMLSSFLPSMSTVMDGLSAIFGGDTEGGLAMIEEGIGSFTDTLDDMMPTIIEVGTSIVTSLATAIVKNLPTLITSGIDAVMTIGDAIIDNADELLSAAKTLISTFATKLLDKTKAGELTNAAVDIIVELGNAITESLPVILPAIVGIVTTIVETLSTPENMSRILILVTDLVEALSTSLVEIAPTLTNVIIPVLWNLAQSIWIALPDIIEAIITVGLNYLLTKWSAILGIFGVKFDDIKSFFASFGIDITNLVESLVTNLIVWFEEAWNFLSTWFGNAVEGLGNFIADIIEAVVNFNTNCARNIANFFTGLWSTALSWFNTAKNYVVSWVNNILSTYRTWLNNLKTAFSTAFNTIRDKISSIVDKAKSLVTNCITTISELPTKVITIGKNLVEGLWNGINDKISWVKNKITSMGSQITSAIKSVFGIASPSKVFAEIGDYLAQGLGVGFEDGMSTVRDDMVDNMDGLTGSMTAEVKAYGASDAAMLGDSTTYNGGSININVYASEGQDVNSLADAIAYKLEEMTTRRSAVYG